MRKVLLLGIICLLLCLFCGCWDSRMLEDTDIVITAGYDLKDPNPQSPEHFSVSVIIPEFAKEAKQKYFIDTTTGMTIGDTRVMRELRLDKYFVANTDQVMLMGERVARQGLHQVTDIILRNPKFINTVPLGVVEGTAQEMLHISTERNPNPGFFLRDLLKNANQQDFIVNLNLQQFAHHSYISGLNPVLPILKTYRNVDAMEPGKFAEISGTAIFKEDQMIGKVGIKESEILAMLRGWASDGYLTQTMPVAGGGMDRFTVVCKNKRNIKVRRVGNEYYYTITVIINGKLTDHAEVQKTLDEKALHKMESILENDLKRRSTAFIDKMQNQFKVDCIDITSYALARWRKDLKGQDFNELVQHYHINVDVKVNITDTGELY